MNREELAELIFEAMSNERIERSNLGAIDWGELPTAHQDKYRRLADCIIGCWNQKPIHALEGIE